MSNNKKYISPNEAIEVYKQKGYGNVTAFAIIEWTKRFSLGIKVGGRWKIDLEKFKKFLEVGVYQK